MDLSNRPFLANGLEFRDEFVGDLSAEMIDHLFMSVTANGQMTTHVVSHAAGRETGPRRRRRQSIREVSQAMRRRGSQTSGAGGEQQGNALRVETRG